MTIPRTVRHITLIQAVHITEGLTAVAIMAVILVEDIIDYEIRPLA